MTNASPDSLDIPRTDQSILKFADDRVEIDQSTYTVTADGLPLRIKGTKFDILQHLASTPDHIISQEVLCTSVWGYYDKPLDVAAKVHVSTIRKLLGPELGNPSTGAIATRRGVGYCALSSLKNDGLLVDKPAWSYSLADERLLLAPESFLVSCDDTIVEDLTNTEYAFLLELAKRPNRMLSGPTLALAAGSKAYDTNSIHMHISNLRKKLGPELGHKKQGAIRTCQNIGYYGVRSLASR